MQVHLIVKDGPVTGFDSCIVVAPDWLDSSPALNVPRMERYFLHLSQYGADAVGETLHHADWDVTADPALVQTKGLTHDCMRCRAGVDQALAYLREHPGRKVLVGMLYWTD